MSRQNKTQVLLEERKESDPGSWKTNLFLEVIKLGMCAVVQSVLVSLSFNLKDRF